MPVIVAVDPRIVAVAIRKRSSPANGYRNGFAGSPDGDATRPSGRNGCSGGMDAFARVVNRLRGAGKDRPLAFTGCCDEHDLFYEQGGSSADRAFADFILRRCIEGNLKQRGRGWWVCLHVPWIFWAAVRLFGWRYWGA